MSAPVDVLAVMDKDRRTATRVPVEDYTKADHFASVEARTAVAELLMDLRRIRDRSTAHPGDTDEDRKRDLRHVVALANQALARVGGAA